jgi:hypothetical protein
MNLKRNGEFSDPESKFSDKANSTKYNTSWVALQPTVPLSEVI